MPRQSCHRPTPHSLLLLILFLTSSLLFQEVRGQSCVPGDNCKLPNCRCWDDKEIPGGLNPNDTPQVVLISFGYVVNAATKIMYTDLLLDIANPNGCPAKGTFFVEDLNSDYDVIRTLHDEKHEIGISTKDGTIPKDQDSWISEYRDMKIKIEQQSGIPANQIIGSRAPDLFVGGDDQFVAMEKSQVEYDSSCVSQVYTTPSTLLWPYTYDYNDGTPTCSVGRTPGGSHKGKWQFLIADLEVNRVKCAIPSACSPFLKNTQEVFDMLFNAFADHYEGKRPPFVLYIDPLWLTVDYQREGTRQFLQFIRAGFDDTWVLTTQQSLAWIKDPVPSSKINDFGPWKC